MQRPPEPLNTRTAKSTALEGFAWARDHYLGRDRVEPDESVVVACLAHRRDLSLARHRTIQQVEPS
ncbi:MAG: hypothetical protein A3H97_03125 [Acidobacteria bacterium RIFCSPLOWO2_02_FULL_65_29]|nr:MAG: hypothetical protein A3H97_03125 [Acidobacteria bacterium RIFCSPLOWO2_02_FULL_65_29]